jgi:BirA family biotin operon repressor/biotin-[acetyl-CoA-carboxylase] ligase
MSEPGKNLTFSFLLDTHFLNITRQFRLNKVISLAIVDYLKWHKIDSVNIKWPNDILVGEKKICGILIENSVSGVNLSYSIIGVGFNLNQTNFGLLSNRACSLSQLTGKTYVIKDEIQIIADNINHRLSDFNDKNEIEINHDYLSLLLGYQSFRKFRINNCIVNGKISGIDDMGSLQIETEDRLLKVFGVKEIEFLYE